MNYTKLHNWPDDKFQAMDIQRLLSEDVEISDNLNEIKLIAAVDTAFGKNAEVVYTAAVVTTFPEIEEVEKKFQYEEVSFPHIPGMFYFREGPAIINVLNKLESDPDILIVHGHGVAHPKFCGTASMIGLAYDKPAIGCSRKLVYGRHRELEPNKGNYQPITLGGRDVGYAYRTKDGVKPLFISPGHRCTAEIAKDIIVRNLRGFRMPEPLRLAHSGANKFRRHIESKHISKN